MLVSASLILWFSLIWVREKLLKLTFLRNGRHHNRSYNVSVVVFYHWQILSRRRVWTCEQMKFCFHWLWKIEMKWKGTHPAGEGWSKAHTWRWTFSLHWPIPNTKGMNFWFRPNESPWITQAFQPIASSKGSPQGLKWNTAIFWINELWRSLP